MNYTVLEFMNELVINDMMDNFNRMQIVKQHYFIENVVKKIKPIKFY